MKVTILGIVFLSLCIMCSSCSNNYMLEENHSNLQSTTIKKTANPTISVPRKTEQKNLFDGKYVSQNSAAYYEIKGDSFKYFDCSGYLVGVSSNTTKKDNVDNLSSDKLLTSETKNNTKTLTFEYFDESSKFKLTISDNILIHHAIDSVYENLYFYKK